MSELQKTLQRPDVSDPKKTLEDWTTLLHELVHEVQGWLPREEWSSRVIEKEMRDSLLGDYKAPALLMQREFTRIVLEPIARFATGADGVIDIYKMPAYDDIASLYRIKNEWKLHFTFKETHPFAKVREAECLDLNEKSFQRVLSQLTAHAG